MTLPVHHPRMMTPYDSSNKTDQSCSGLIPLMGTFQKSQIQDLGIRKPVWTYLERKNSSSKNTFLLSFKGPYFKIQPWKRPNFLYLFSTKNTGFPSQLKHWDIYPIFFKSSNFSQNNVLQIFFGNSLETFWNVDSISEQKKTSKINFHLSDEVYVLV